MIIKFQILKSIVREAVQNATYIKGQIDKTTQNASNSVMQSETMGDETIHERTFTHDFDSALELLKTFFVDYLVPTAQTIGDNSIYYGNKTDDIVEFTLDVSRRYNGTLTDALARLSAKYIEDYIVNEWWIKTTNVKQAEIYTAKLQSDEQAIRKCFILSAPKIPSTPYTKHLTAKVDGTDLGGAITLVINEDATLSYSIDEGAIDDIEARSNDCSILEIHRCQEKYAFTLRPVNTGFTSVRLFSRHSELTVDVDVTIREEE